MRVVVTGATGNVGTSVVDALLADDQVDSVLALARRPSPKWQADGLELATADVVIDDLVPHFEGADVVIHLAWAIQPSRDDRMLRAVNVDGSRRVFEAVAASGAGALVYASSVGAYSPGPVDRHPVDESWPTDGIQTSFYSRHKAEVESILDGFEAEHPNLRVVRLRPALIFKGESGTEIRRLFGGPFVPSPLLKPGRLPVFPWISGLATQAVHADDVGAAYALAATADVQGAFNIAADPILDATTLAAALGVRIISLPERIVRGLAAASWRVRLQPTPEGWVDMGLHSPLMSTARAATELGWTPRRTATDTFVELLNGLAAGSGRATPPLDPATSGKGRSHEISTGIGARD